MLFTWDVEGLCRNSPLAYHCHLCPVLESNEVLPNLSATSAKTAPGKCSRPKTNQWQGSLPIGSMYGIFTYIWLIFMVNVGRYTIHGSYGLYYQPKQCTVKWELPQNWLIYFASSLIPPKRMAFNNPCITMEKETFWRCTVSIRISYQKCCVFSTVVLGFRGV